jgi:tartronate-semialdehyde synthase
MTSDVLASPRPSGREVERFTTHKEEDPMAKMSAMDAAASILVDEGVEVIFGIPGAGILPFYQSLMKSGKIKHYIARHEEGAIHMADGYARAIGRVGICAATSGPGASNFVTGLYTAQVDSIPIIAITGQNVRAQLGKEAFQAVDIAEVVKPITKKSYCVKEPAQVPWVFREAFRIAQEGRPGSILIDLPLDVQKGEIEYDPAVDTKLEFTRPSPNEKQVRKAIEMLLEAKNPVFLLGGGVITADACREFAELAEYLQVPVVTTHMGKGGISFRHPLYAGQVGIQCNTRCGNKMFLESDLVLGIGCRFNDRHTGTVDVYAKGRKFIHIDIDPMQIGKIICPALGIVSDAKRALEALTRVAKEMTPPRSSSESVKRLYELREELARKLDFDDVPIKPQRVFKEINEFFDDETVFVTCIGLNQIWSGQFQEIHRPRHYLDCGGAGPLGWDLPAAIGAKIARPDNLVVQIVGDYGFQFCSEELAVASMYNIPVLSLIINNGYLSLIRQSEKYGYNMNYEVAIWYEGDEKMINFVKFAEAFGAHGERVETPDQIKPAIQRALRWMKQMQKPALIDIIVERETDASMGASIDAVREFEEEREKEKKKARLKRAA